MKIFVLWYQEYDEADILGVYSTLDKAQDAPPKTGPRGGKRPPIKWEYFPASRWNDGYWQGTRKNPNQRHLDSWKISVMELDDA